VNDKSGVVIQACPVCGEKFPLHRKIDHDWDSQEMHDYFRDAEEKQTANRIAGIVISITAPGFVPLNGKELPPRIDHIRGLAVDLGVQPEAIIDGVYVHDRDAHAYNLFEMLRRLLERL
jgi:hypothetical protein